MRDTPRPLPRLGSAFLAGVLLALLAALAAADVIVLKDGRRIEGQVVKKTSTEVVVKTSVGEVTFPRQDVVEIIPQKTTQEEYEERLAACKTAEDYYQLGKWCVEQRLKRRAEKLYRRAIEVDPDHAGARRELGFVEHRGEWVTPAERDRRIAAEYEAEMKAKGFVLFDGRWVSPEEKDHLEKGEVLHEGKWLPKATAMRAQGLEEFQGEWYPIPEARGRNAAFGAAAAAGMPLALHLNEEALVCGTIATTELAEIGDGILRGRAWFNEHWQVKPGLKLFGGQLAEFYVFDEPAAYEGTIPYIASRSRHIPKGWSEAVGKTFGFVWTDPIAISSAIQRNRSRRDLVGHCYHHLGHLMLNRLGYDGKLLPPWYDEGVAAITELRCHGHNAVFCRSGVAAAGGSASGGGRPDFDWRMFRDGSWREEFAKAVREGQVEPFDKLARREFGQLSLLDIAASMAIVEWLDAQGEDTLQRFHRVLRQGAPPAPLRVIAAGNARQKFYDTAFRAAVEMDHRQADNAWRQWLGNR